ncbi:MAG: methyltransferase domain-containing protein [Bacteroidota bacterium]
MAAIDHSLTYRKKGLKNLPHRLRLKAIVQYVGKQKPSHPKIDFVDVGCSNGYITDLLSKEFDFETVSGLDHTLENLEKAGERYPSHHFSFIDLNVELPLALRGRYDLVTCFETLEHVGNLKNGVQNLIDLAKPGGTIIITVPIEVKLPGLVKYLAKLGYGYNLNELPGKVSKGEYLGTLISSGKIGKYRSETRTGWGTHFGFDYRDLERLLSEKGIRFTAESDFTSRFITILKPAE